MFVVVWYLTTLAGWVVLNFDVAGAVLTLQPWAMVIPLRISQVKKLQAFDKATDMLLCY